MLGLSLPVPAAEPGSSEDGRDGARATTPAERLRETVRGHLAAGRIDAALEAAQRAIAAYPNDDEVRDEFVSLHLSLARPALTDEDFELAERALSAVRQVDAEEPRARKLLYQIRAARQSVPRRLSEAREWIELEWFEPAFVAFRQASALVPKRAAEWRGDYLAAAIGAGDDNYITKNFHDAFYYYDAAMKLGEQAERVAPSRLLMRWAQCLTHALARDVNRTAYPPDFWRLVLSRAEGIKERGRSTPDDQGAASLRWLLRGLAYENMGDPRRAAGEYGRYLGVTGFAPEDVRTLRERAIKKLRGLYDVELCDRRTGPWARVSQGEWQTLDAGGFKILHRNDLVAARVAAAAEFHFARIADLLALDIEEIPWAMACEIRIHAGDREFRKATGQGAGVRGISVINARGGQLVSHEIHLIQTDPLLLSASLSHEIAHLIVGAVTQYRDMPGVISEGLALQVEPKCRRRQFARLFDDLRRPPDLAVLLKESRTHPPEAEFYSAAFRLTELLRGHRGLRALLDTATGESIAIEDLSRQYGFPGRRALEERYLGRRSKSPEGGG